MNKDIWLTGTMTLEWQHCLINMNNGTSSVVPPPPPSFPTPPGFPFQFNCSMPWCSVWGLVNFQWAIKINLTDKRPVPTLMRVSLFRWLNTVACTFGFSLALGTARLDVKNHIEYSCREENFIPGPSDFLALLHVDNNKSKEGELQYLREFSIRV